MKVLGYQIPFTKRSSSNTGVDFLRPSTWAGLFGTATSSGENVNPKSALSFSAVYSATSIISDTIGSLSCIVYERENENKRRAIEHPIYTLLHDEPNSLMTSFTFFQTLQASCLIYGNGYALIQRAESGRPTALQYMHPDKVSPLLHEGVLYYKIEGASTPIQASDMVHVPGLSFDGLKGKGIIEVAAENIGLALAAQSYGSEYFKNGGNVSGVLHTDQKLGDAAINNLKNSWQSSYGSKGNRAGTPILEQGLKYQSITIPPEQAQFIQTRKFSIQEVARFFKVPPHLMADLDRSTNNNIEHQSMEFVQHCIRPWAKRFEQELNRKLFRDNERQKYFVKFNIDSLLRGDSKSRAEFYNKLFPLGVLNQNDIRRQENMNDIEGGDRYYVQNTFIPVDLVDKQKQLQND
jgi:HK97 family phage portal protein|tara:strand:+ start:2377 stop:3597 length:1221 start_codon:yes stop_codon:yes gene_type:complete